MRFLVITLLSCLLLTHSSCKSTKKATEDKILLKIDSLDNGFRKLYLLKNKKLEVLTTNGSLSYTIGNNNSTNVLQFVYEKDMDQAAYDGGYREEVVFEIPNNSVNQNYTNEVLQKTKMLFGRYCNCRGQNGLFKVSQGKLHITASKKETHFELHFKIIEVPQITDSITY